MLSASGFQALNYLKMIAIFSQTDNNNSPDISWLDNNTGPFGELPSWLLEILAETAYHVKLLGRIQGLHDMRVIHGSIAACAKAARARDPPVRNVIRFLMRHVECFITPLAGHS